MEKHTEQHIQDELASIRNEIDMLKAENEMMKKSTQKLVRIILEDFKTWKKADKISWFEDLMSE